MHHRRFHRRRPPLGARFYASENVLERLDEYQRDLEQELADVVELIKRLRAEEAPQGEDRASDHLVHRGAGSAFNALSRRPRVPFSCPRSLFGRREPALPRSAGSASSTRRGRR